MLQTFFFFFLEANLVHQNQAPRHFIPQFAFHGNKLN